MQSAMARVSELSSALAPAAPLPPAPPAAAPADGDAFAGQLKSAMAAGAPTANAAGLTGGAPAQRGNYPNLTGDVDAGAEILGRLEALAAKRGEKFNVTSGLRTRAEQQRLWDNRASNPYPVAKPGNSLHHSGRAADVTIGGRPIQSVIGAAELRRAGLRPLAGDAVHVELP